MLSKLYIEQYVIIDKLDVNFESGLTILTGETGAGKSILLDAMELLLGAESDPSSIRRGSDESIIIGTFDPPKTHSTWMFLNEKNLIEDPNKAEFVIHRVMRTDGNDELKVNNKLVDRELLVELGFYLIEIHGQFANQSLLAPDNQLNLLDLAGNFPPEIHKNVADALNDVRKYEQELEEENVFLARHTREAGKIEKIVNKFDEINMRQGLVEEVKIEFDRLLTAKDTGEAFQAILAQLVASNGVVAGLSSANMTLSKQENIDQEKIADLTKYLADALENTRAAVNEMGVLSPEYEIDLAPLQYYRDTIEALKEISKEYKIKYKDLYEFYDENKTTLHRIRNGTERLKELDEFLHKAKLEYRTHADVLSEKRTEAAVEMSLAITRECAPLKLPKAEFIVEVRRQADMEWTEKGFDVVTFTARMNPGMPFSPIAETASGGELARMILALKVVLEKVQIVSTLVFDEVDTGIGGAAAAAVGQRIAELAENTQVIVITHSPQVASRGHQHLHISKKTDGETTTSAVHKLTMDERVDEISRMLAGDEITSESRAAAKSLITEAEQAAEERRAMPSPAAASSNASDQNTNQNISAQ